MDPTNSTSSEEQKEHSPTERDFAPPSQENDIEIGFLTHTQEYKFTMQCHSIDFNMWLNENGGYLKYLTFDELREAMFDAP